jgi:hypothetical protein
MVFVKTKKVGGLGFEPGTYYIKQPADEPLGYVHVAVNIALRFLLNYTVISVAHPCGMRHEAVGLR